MAFSLNSVNSGTLRVGSIGNTALTTDYTTASGITIGGVLAATGFAGSNNSFTFNVPDFTNGAVFPLFGTLNVTITNGTNPSSLSVTFAPKATQTVVTLTSVGVALKNRTEPKFSTAGSALSGTRYSDKASNSLYTGVAKTSKKLSLLAIG